MRQLSVMSADWNEQLITQIIQQFIPDYQSGDRKSRPYSFQTCCGDMLEQTVDNILQIVSAGRRPGIVAIVVSANFCD